MINPLEALKVIELHRASSVVVPTMQSNVRWSLVSSRPDLDLPLTGCMGKASSLALGLALAQPKTKVIVIDGDGSLLMNLGTLVTIGEQAPSNLIHISFDNGVYATTGSQPVPGSHTVDFAECAKSSGYRSTCEFEHLEDFISSVEDLFTQEGPIFINLKIQEDLDCLSADERMASRATLVASYPAMKSLFAS